MSELPSSWLGWTRRRRTATALAALVLFGLLVLAARLEPSPDGIGTHQQLGLPPCSFRAVMGIPCPSCGMTTSWAYFVRGRWFRAWQANAGGTVLALVTAAAVPWLLVSAARARWFVIRLSEWEVFLVSFVVLTITTIHWLIRILPNVWR